MKAKIIETNLAEVKKSINNHKYLGDDGWFFPSDIRPHSAKFKRMCKKLFENNILDRRGVNGDRWGFQYKFKNLNHES